MRRLFLVAAIPSVQDTEWDIAKAITGMRASGKPTVAIVNDEPGILQAVRSGLERGGYDVRTYANTADALELIGRPADIVFMDGSNWPFNGIELYR